MKVNILYPAMMQTAKIKIVIVCVLVRVSMVKLYSDLWENQELVHTFDLRRISRRARIM